MDEGRARWTGGRPHKHRVAKCCKQFSVTFRAQSVPAALKIIESDERIAVSRCIIQRYAISERGEKKGKFKQTEAP